MRPVAVLMVIAIALGGCTAEKEKEPEAGLSGTCGLRKIARDVDESRVYDEFLLQGVEIAKTADFKGRFIATINAPYSVNEAYRAYLDQIKEAGWDIFTHETEVFEAEIYFSDRKEAGSIQVRTSTCEGKAVVYASLVDREVSTDN